VLGHGAFETHRTFSAPGQHQFTLGRDEGDAEVVGREVVQRQDGFECGGSTADDDHPVRLGVCGRTDLRIVRPARASHIGVHPPAHSVISTR
jgi:hypothetical protein